jgi:hypothetical protein
VFLQAPNGSEEEARYHVFRKTLPPPLSLNQFAYLIECFINNRLRMCIKMSLSLLTSSYSCVIHRGEKKDMGKVINFCFVFFVFDRSLL